MLVIVERLRRARIVVTEFAAANPDLLVTTPSVPADYYSAALLSSDRARRAFVMPDRLLTHVVVD